MSRLPIHAVTSETAAFAKLLMQSLDDAPVAIQNAATGEATPLPPHLAALIRDIFATLAEGRPVAVTAVSEEMTPNEAAEFLNVSRPFVIKLMESGALPFRQVGAHRRIPFADVAAYKAEQAAKSRVAMDELVALSEELGLYGMEGQPPKSAFKGPAGRDD